MGHAIVQPGAFGTLRRWPGMMTGSEFEALGRPRLGAREEANPQGRQATGSGCRAEGHAK
jgi:hypothetical protein